MAGTKNPIPLHKLKESTDKGYRVEHVESITEEFDKVVLLNAHRDDYYIILFQETGSSSAMVDFNTVSIAENCLFYIMPGQVHRYIDAADDTTGWFIALDPELIPARFRTTLEDPFLPQKPLQPDGPDREAIVQCLKLIHSFDKRVPYTSANKQIIHSLIASLVAMVSAIFCGKDGVPVEMMSRPIQITRQFYALLSKDYKVRKSPAEYAAALNISPTYLNEVVKATTGFSASYRIQQEVVLEAKRLLYHSEISIKEIAHELGYEDHTYFSRLFKKVIGQTPGEFRQGYRE